MNNKLENPNCSNDKHSMYTKEFVSKKVNAFHALITMYKDLLFVLIFFFFLFKKIIIINRQ
jgi:hypothetical protein